LTKTITLKNLEAVKKNEETPIPVPKYALNEYVNVQSRTKSGENRPGGVVAQITNSVDHIRWNSALVVSRFDESVVSKSEG
jgi:hypothetical protein